MSAHCDFSEQTVEGDSKPDLIVRLPGERLIIVDAKVPDLDFLNAIESADPVNAWVCEACGAEWTDPEADVTEDGSEEESSAL